MRIAQIAPLWYRVPPKTFGGTELVIHNLTEELVKRGHQVTLFASGDSRTKARLVAGWPKPLIEENIKGKRIAWENAIFPLLNLSLALKRHNEFDLIHIHEDDRGLSNFFLDYIPTPKVITLHNPLPHPIEKDKYAVFKKYARRPYVSISQAQRKSHFLKLRFLATVYNGLDIKKIAYNPKPKKYLFWLGRFTQAKGVHLAVEVARKEKIPLILAGQIDTKHKENKKYFEKRIKPFINQKIIRYVGEVNHQQKVKWLKNALALINPIIWSEPFGLVMVEAMACGTPVIAYDRGAAPEVVKDKKTGFIVKTTDQIIQAIKKIDQIDRAECRKWVEKKFTAEKMTDGYEKVYQKVLKLNKK